MKLNLVYHDILNLENHLLQDNALLAGAGLMYILLRHLVLRTVRDKIRLDEPPF